MRQRRDRRKRWGGGVLILVWDIWCVGEGDILHQEGLEYVVVKVAVGKQVILSDVI